MMHIVHLALAVDVITSCLLDWSDDQTFVWGSSREKRLTSLWDSYRKWCEIQKVSDRSSRKLFTTNGLKPDVGRYLDISQKVLSATAARYMLFWLSSIAKQYAAWTNLDIDM